MQRDSVFIIFGCLVWIVVIIGVYGGCEWYESYTKRLKSQEIAERKRNDSIRAAFVKDSLAHDPVYQDSLKKVEETRLKWKIVDDSIRKIEIVGFVMEGDSIYHNNIHGFRRVSNHLCGFLLSDIPHIRVLTGGDLDGSSYELCPTCEEIDETYSRYEDGELFSEDDAKEHDLIPIDEIDEYRGLFEEDDRW